jgi:hypothetical protein
VAGRVFFCLKKGDRKKVTVTVFRAEAKNGDKKGDKKG